MILNKLRKKSNRHGMLIQGRDVSFFWKLLISEHYFSRLSWWQWCMYFLFYGVLDRFFFSYKDHECYVFDYIIVVKNPVLTYHLLVNYSEKHKGKRVGLVFDGGDDYWGYHITKEYSFAGLSDRLKRADIEVVLLNTDDDLVIKTTRIESYSGKRVALHLSDKESESRSSNGYQKIMTKTVELFNKSRNLLNAALIEELKTGGQAKVGRFNHPPQYSHSSGIHSYILFTENITLTGLSIGWCHVDAHQGNGLTYFKYDHEMSNENKNKMPLFVGSAVSIADNFVAFQNKTQDDINQLK